MSDTYTQHALICSKFYSLTVDSNAVASFIYSLLKAVPGQKTLFVGGMFEVAAGLVDLGLNITAVDYTDEMVAVGSSALPKARILKADLKDLNFSPQFDSVVIIGRVLTHMISDADLKSALKGCHRALLPGGVLLADNYESSKIQKTNYFNGQISCSDGVVEIVRSSKTELVSTSPHVVNWQANYSGRFQQQEFAFSDSMEHRAFSRTEFATELTAASFEVLEQGDNFDETSFYSLARKL